MNIKNDIKPFGIKRNLDYIKVNIWLMYKRFVEYKVNFYSMIIESIVWFVIQFFLIFVIYDNFASIIGWSFNDFILLMVLVNISWNIIGIFNWGFILQYYVVDGKINLFLMKPLNTPFKVYFYDLDETGFLFFIISIIYSISLIYFFQIKFYNIFLGIIIFFLIILLFTLFELAIDSFNLLKIGLSNIFMFIRIINENFQSYPAQFFQNTKLKYFLNILPLYFLSSLLIPILQNHENFTMNMFFVQLLILILSLIIVILILIFNWHYGLKKYEAFG